MLLDNNPCYSFVAGADFYQTYRKNMDFELIFQKKWWGIFEIL